MRTMPMYEQLCDGPLLNLMAEQARSHIDFEGKILLVAVTYPFLLKIIKY